MTSFSYLICGQFDPNGNMVPYGSGETPERHRAYLGGLDGIEQFMMNTLSDLQELDIPPEDAADFLKTYGGDEDRLYRVTINIQEINVDEATSA